MNSKVEYVREGNFVKVTNSGLFSSRGHLDMIQAIISQDYWKPGMPIFLDNRELEFPKPGFPEMMAAAENHVEFDALIGGGKAANLMNSVSGFGSGRQYQLITDDHVSSRLRIFMNEKDALDWLLSDAN